MNVTYFWRSLHYSRSCLRLDFRFRDRRPQPPSAQAPGGARGLFILFTIVLVLGCLRAYLTLPIPSSYRVCVPRRTYLRGSWRRGPGRVRPGPPPGPHVHALASRPRSRQRCVWAPIALGRFLPRTPPVPPVLGTWDPSSMPMSSSWHLRNSSLKLHKVPPCQSSTLSPSVSATCGAAKPCARISS